MKAMEFFAAKNLPPSKLKGTTLVMPAVSIGNVGQLAVDLLVEALSPPRVGFLEDPHVLPCVGNDPYGHMPSGTLTTAMEVFQDAGKALTIMQQRAPVVQGRLDDFARDLATWVRESGFREVVLLTGANAGKRKTEQMEGDQLRYFSSASADSASAPGLDPRCEAPGWTRLEGLEEGLRDLEASLAEATLAEEGGANGTGAVQGEGGRRGGAGGVDKDEEEEEEEEEMGHPGPLEGGQWGVEQDSYVWKTPVWRLFCELKSQGIPVLVLLLFCNEGDNVGDAFTMADRANALLHLVAPPAKQGGGGAGGGGAPRWRAPLSWAHLFGPPPDFALFG